MVEKFTHKDLIDFNQTCGRLADALQARKNLQKALENNQPEDMEDKNVYYSQKNSWEGVNRLVFWEAKHLTNIVSVKLHLE